MPYVLVRHKVADFSKWKPVYDAHLPARKEAGIIKEVHLLRNADDPNELVIMFEEKACKRPGILRHHQICVKRCRRQEWLTDQISTFSNSILAPATGTGLGDALPDD